MTSSKFGECGVNPGSINPGSINPEYQSGVSIQGARRGCEHHSTGSTHGFPAMAVLFRRLSVLLLRVLAHVAPGVLKSDVLHLTVASEGELGVAIGLLFLLTRWFICLRVGSIDRGADAGSFGNLGCGRSCCDPCRAGVIIVALG